MLRGVNKSPTPTPWTALAPANQIALPSCGICDISSNALAVIAIPVMSRIRWSILSIRYPTASIVAIVPMPRGEMTRPAPVASYPKGPSLSDGRKTIVVKINAPTMKL